jgi:hypothetical protein
MTNDRGDVRDVNFRQLMPFTEIFRAFNLALDPSKLILALAAVVLLWAGWSLLGWIYTPQLLDLSAREQNPFGVWPANATRGKNPFDTVSHTFSGVAPSKDIAKPGEGGLLSHDFWLGNESLQGPVQLEPFHKILGPVVLFLNSSPLESRWWFLLMGMLYTLAVWGLFAGAITRIAAVQYARKEKLGLGEAIRFARAKYKSFLIAPLLPLAGILAMAVLMFLGSLMIHIPWLGVFLASVLWFLPLIAGVVIVIMMLAYIGWPIMYATISAEGSDSFDAISRSLAYVWQRPAHYFFYFIVAALYGILVTFLVVLVVTCVVFAAKWGVGNLESQFSWYYSDKAPAVSSLFIYAPESYHWREILTGRPPAQWAEMARNMDWPQTIAAVIMAVWMHLMFLLVVAFAYSYFWCAGTIIYFLMRKKVDDTDLDEVYLEEEEPFLMESPMSPGAGPATLPMAPPPSEPVTTKASEPESKPVASDAKEAATPSGATASESKP